MEIDFNYDKEKDFLLMNPIKELYFPLAHLNSYGWTSSIVQSIIDKVQNIENSEEEVEDFTIDGITGYIWVFPNIKKANVFESGISVKNPPPSLLELTLDELLEFLNKLKDFLLSIGK